MADTPYTVHDIFEILKTVIDPEMGVNIVDLGLVYTVKIKDNSVSVDFTLTYPGCPMEEYIRSDIERTIRRETPYKEILTSVVWFPRWTPELMSEEARFSLGFPI